MRIIKTTPNTHINLTELVKVDINTPNILLTYRDLSRTTHQGAEAEAILKYLDEEPSFVVSGNIAFNVGFVNRFVEQPDKVLVHLPSGLGIIEVKEPKLRKDLEEAISIFNGDVAA